MNDIKFDEKHLKFFSENLKEKQNQWVGRNPSTWINALNRNACIKINNDQNGVFNFKPTRSSLYDQSADKIQDFDFVVNVLAWGGMHLNHGRAVLKKYEHWGHIVNELRNNKIDPFDGYKKFMGKRLEGKLPGMGPAYFTKIIFFATQNQANKPNAYIMDQWTARSINLLLGHELVSTIKTHQGSRVSDNNTSETYKKFCEVIEHLSSLIGEPDPKKTEEHLFSNGGRNAGAWRRYLK